MAKPRGSQKPVSIGKPRTGAPSKPLTRERPKATGSPHEPKRNVTIPKGKGK